MTIITGRFTLLSVWGLSIGVLNDFLKEWGVRMDELKSDETTRDEYFE